MLAFKRISILHVFRRHQTCFLVLKKQSNLGFGQDETVHPLLRRVYLGEHNVWAGAGVFTEPGFSLIM